MGWESSGVVGFDLGPLLEGQMRTDKLKSAYNSLIIGPRGFGALSLRWIQFASVLRCARSSFILFHKFYCYCFYCFHCLLEYENMRTENENMKLEIFGGFINSTVIRFPPE